MEQIYRVQMNSKGMPNFSTAKRIVKCKECKHWHIKDDLTYCDKINYGYGYKADDFCSYGEWKENCYNCKDFWHCDAQCDEMPQIEDDEPKEDE